MHPAKIIVWVREYRCPCGAIERLVKKIGYENISFEQVEAIFIALYNFKIELPKESNCYQELYNFLHILKRKQGINFFVEANAWVRAQMKLFFL